LPHGRKGAPFKDAVAKLNFLLLEGIALESLICEMKMIQVVVLLQHGCDMLVHTVHCFYFIGKVRGEDFNIHVLITLIKYTEY